MSVASQKEVAKALTFSCKMTGLELDEDEKSYYLHKLKGRMSGSEIITALDDLVEKDRKPTLSAILAYEKGGFDDSETAYAKAIASITDESKTCLMNDAIMKAWSIAQPLYSEGMNYDASRAFKSAYEEAVREQKELGYRKPKWFLSMGTDKTQREEFIRQSTSDGLISIEYAKSQLPHMTSEELNNPNCLPNSSPVLRLEQNLDSQEGMSKEDIEEGKEAIFKLKMLLGAK